MLYTQGKETMESHVGGLMARPGVVYITVPSSSHWWDSGLGSNQKKGNRETVSCVAKKRKANRFSFPAHMLCLLEGLTSFTSVYHSFLSSGVWGLLLTGPWSSTWHYRKLFVDLMKSKHTNTLPTQATVIHLALWKFKTSTLGICRKLFANLFFPMMKYFTI